MLYRGDALESTESDMTTALQWSKPVTEHTDSYDTPRCREGGSLGRLAPTERRSRSLKRVSRPGRRGTMTTEIRTARAATTFPRSQPAVARESLGSHRPGSSRRTRLENAAAEAVWPDGYDEDPGCVRRRARLDSEGGSSMSEEFGVPLLASACANWWSPR
jgi:hypothetical protein